MDVIVFIAIGIAVSAIYTALEIAKVLRSIRKDLDDINLALMDLRIRNSALEEKLDDASAQIFRTQNDILRLLSEMYENRS